MRRYEESFRRGHAAELSPFSSTQEAYTVISREATAELGAADADEIAQKRRMI